MLGEKIGQERGRITSTKVLSVSGGTPLLEVSFQASGQVFGIETTEVGTYTALMMPGGMFHGQGQGMLTTNDGEVASWTGSGVGKPTGKGMAANWRGAIYFQTTSNKLARLNGLAVVFEYDVDAEGNTRSTTWEWK